VAARARSGYFYHHSGCDSKTGVLLQPIIFSDISIFSSSNFQPIHSARIPSPFHPHPVICCSRSPSHSTRSGLIRDHSPPHSFILFIPSSSSLSSIRSFYSVNLQSFFCSRHIRYGLFAIHRLRINNILSTFQPRVSSIPIQHNACIGTTAKSRNWRRHRTPFNLSTCESTCQQTNITIHCSTQ
jgi:hypothetical protein